MNAMKWKSTWENRKYSGLPAQFTLSAAAILVVTGSAKIWSAFGNTKLLLVTDPITGIQFGNLMLGVGLVELVIAGICVLGKAQGLSIALVAWLATSFVAYRLGLASMGWQKPCSCLGDITEALRISSQTADNIMKFVLAYLLIGSYGVLTRYGWAAGPANCYPVSGNSSEI